MFEQTLSLDSYKTNRGWTVLASVGGQIAFVGTLLLTPLIYPDAIPLARLGFNLIEPPLPPPPRPITLVATPRTVPAAPPQFDGSRLFAPVKMPTSAPLVLTDREMPPGGMAAGVEGGIPQLAGSLGSIIGAIARAIPGPVAQPAAAPVVKPTAIPAAQAGPVRVGGDVQRAKLIKQVLPVYPQLARQARISGLVQLIGVISKDGTIRELRLVSGSPLLAPAALEAVRQWVYQPTLLNGEPVEVVAPIDVHFTLQR